jgi:hypothetical protein
MIKNRVYAVQILQRRIFTLICNEIFDFEIRTIFKVVYSVGLRRSTLPMQFYCYEFFEEPERFTIFKCFSLILDEASAILLVEVIRTYVHAQIQLKRYCIQQKTRVYYYSFTPINIYKQFLEN